MFSVPLVGAAGPAAARLRSPCCRASADVVVDQAVVQQIAQHGRDARNGEGVAHRLLPLAPRQILVERHARFRAAVVRFGAGAA